MTDKINNIVEGINATLEWFRVNKPEQYEQQFGDLVAKRLELRTILETLSDNPGIAAYGESQKGKSYLMSNLLQDNGSPFMIKGPNGKEYNYVSELNPPGDGQEATGVVTRFTSFHNNPSKYSAQYPVLMKVHRVHEIITILSDAYHFDVTDYEQWSDSELDAMAQNLLMTYGGREVDEQNVVIEDDVISIKNYLVSYVNGSQMIYKSAYLDTLATVIRKVRVDEFHKVFAPLWHMQPEVTDLFRRLLDVLKSLEFSKEIYLPMDAIEHKEIKPRTIMSVQCLQGVYIPDFEHRTSAYLRKGNDYVEIKDFNRSFLSAVCREVVLKVEDRYLECMMKYDTTMIPKEVQARIPRMEFKRNLLNHADLLDFPGARNREKLYRRNLSNIDTDNGEHNMIKLLLRGKIAYLFNHYNSARALNLLMFCHDTKNVGVTEMYQVIEKWIDTYVGPDAVSRARTIKECDGIPPFFVISTMFNKDMVENNQDPNKNLAAALEQRWINRFNILYKEAFHGGTDVDWFKSWSGEGVKFNNTFVLRDFKYSAVGGGGSNLYQGFGPANPKEESMALSPEHFENMRRTYVELLKTHDVLKNMVEDPELSWDLSATINNDGSVYIIDRLTIVAARLSALRERQFGAVATEIKNRLNQLLSTIYVDPKGRDAIRETRRSVGMMRLSFDCATNADNYFFGRLLDNLEITIRDAYHVVQQAINDPEVTKSVHESDDWEVVRLHLQGCKTKDDCLERLMDVYGCFTKEDLYDIFESKGMNIDDIIANRTPSPKVSDVIAGRIVQAWADKLSRPANVQQICGTVLNLTAYGILRDKLLSVARLYGLQKLIADRISDLTDINNLNSVNQYQVADTIAITINEFVQDWGYSTLSSEQQAKLARHDSEYSFNALPVINERRTEVFDEDALTALFAQLTSTTGGLSESFRFNYRRWFAFLTLAFLRVEVECGVVIENPAANNAAGDIIKSLQKVG